MTVGRWVLVILIALVLVGLLAYARGPDHRRGDDVGALPRAVRTERTAV